MPIIPSYAQAYQVCFDTIALMILRRTAMPMELRAHDSLYRTGDACPAAGWTPYHFASRFQKKGESEKGVPIPMQGCVQA